MSTKGIINVASEEVPVTIEEYCEILTEYEKNTGKKITRGNKYNEELKVIDDQLLIELCDKGWSYHVILKHLLDNDYVISLPDLQKRIREIYKNEVIEKRPLITKKKRARKSGISDDEIMALFNKGVSYVDMAKHFKNIGKEITSQRLSEIVKEIYKNNGEERPKRKIKNLEVKPKKNKLKRVGEAEYQTIFKLREEGKSYEHIADYFRQREYKISATSISNLCKKIYKEEGKNEPVIDKRLPSLATKKIFELREEGLSYKDIQKELKANGIDLSLTCVVARCHNEYKRRNIQLCGKNSKNNSMQLLQKITDNELENLLRQKYTYTKIKELYKKRGIEVSNAYIEKRVRMMRIRLKNNNSRNINRDDNSVINFSTIDDKKFNSVLLNLRESKDATDEQLKKIADYYGFKFDKEATLINPYNILGKSNFDR